MPRLYIKLSIPLTLILFMPVLAGIAIGKTQPLPKNPAAAGFILGCEGKSQPCWYGIQPGSTTEKKALQILHWLGYTVTEDPNTYSAPIKFWITDLPPQQLCRVDFDIFPQWANASGTRMIRLVFRFQLQDCSNLYLKDLIGVLKNPMIAYSCGSGGGGKAYFPHWWLNSPFTGSARPDLVPPTLPDDAIDNMDYGYTEWSKQGSLIDPSWYGYVTQKELRSILWDKYCKYG